jgi:hypothetical protein
MEMAKTGMRMENMTVGIPRKEALAGEINADSICNISLTLE